MAANDEGKRNGWGGARPHPEGRKGGRPRTGRRRHEITPEAAKALVELATGRMGRPATVEEEGAVLSALVIEAATREAAGGE